MCEVDVVVFALATTTIIFSLAAAGLTLLLIQKKKKIKYQQRMESMALTYKQGILKTQIEIQEQTFKHIAREIHDNINLSLTLTKLALLTLDVTNPNKTQTMVTNSTETISSVIDDLKDLSRSMNTDLIKNLGLLNALPIEMKRIRQMAKVKTEVIIEGNSYFMDSEKELVLFRIIQEACNNAITHGHASQIILKLCYTNENLFVEVCDNGGGFDPDVLPSTHEQGSGLFNMKARADLCGGSVHLESDKEKGTKVIISIPK